MKQPELTVRLGQLCLLLRGALPPKTPESYLWRFADTGAPDVTCEIFLLPRLSAPEGVPTFRDYGKCVYETDAATCIAYFTPGKAAECCALLTEPRCAPAQLTLQISDHLKDHLEKYILSCLAMEHLLLRHGAAIFHAAWFEREGKALLFSGASGAGKSTHTALWTATCDVEIINGDKALLYRRGDALWTAGLPFAGSSGICKSRALPVHSVVFLSHGEENALRRMELPEAARMLLSQMPLQRWCAGDVSAALELALFAAERLPVYAYACRPDASAVAYLERAQF